MGIKFVIDGTPEDVGRLLFLPQTGDMVDYQKKGEDVPRLYRVVLVHHKLDRRSQVGRGDTLIHLTEEERPQVDTSKEELIEAANTGEEIITDDVHIDLEDEEED